ncbi:C-C chemokine receptor type 8-like isoform X2 [Melanotaenia boesemani]|uniref:C-C chemokine receptor type 8-like isoform X2 n=1 Tax=Melanotaenia boesemani TaxID=1250792 RepID=UPI001C04B33A|nr:C-C chemokine receptor type 8-like isoform X2 [Melanotaenia boesemani]
MNIHIQEQKFRSRMCCVNTSYNESLEYIDMYDDGFAFCDQDDNPYFHSGSTVMLVLYYVLFSLGVLGNCTVLWVLQRYIKLRTMTDVFILNLVLSDLLLAVSLPLWAYSSHSIPSCKMITGVYQVGFFSGTLFVTLMSVDRYFAIVHAVAALQARTLRYGIVASIIIWEITIIMAVPQVIFASLGTVAGDNANQQCELFYPEETEMFWKKLRNFTENTVGLFVCFPIMIYCYVKILIVLSKSRNSKRHKAVKLILTVVCVFMVCWIPYNIIVFLTTLQLFNILNTCEASQAINMAMGFAEIIALSHCCVNPVIYALIGEKFKKSLGKVLMKYFRFHYQSRDTTENETSNTPVRSDQ